MASTIVRPYSEWERWKPKTTKGDYQRTAASMLASPDYYGASRYPRVRTGIAIAHRRILLIGENRPFLEDCTSGPVLIKPNAMRAEDV